MTLKSFGKLTTKPRYRTFSPYQTSALSVQSGLVVFDSCFSGTIFKQRSGSEKLLYIQSVMNRPVRQFLTAGDADQRVPAKSVFTPLFIRALEGEADVMRDGYVTGSELGLYLKQHLSEYTKIQTPQFGAIRDPDLDQGDIVFRAFNTPSLVAKNLSRPTLNPSSESTNLDRNPPTSVMTPQANPSPQLTAKVFYDSGNSKRESGDNRGAIADYNQAIKLKPDFAEAYHNRGLTKSNLGDKQGAIADYDQAIKFNSDIVEAYNNRGNSKRDLGDNQGAITDFNQAITLKPDYADAYHNRGIAKFSIGDNQGAIIDYNQAIILKPDFAEAYYARGLAKFSIGDNQGAITDYNQVIKLKPDHALAYHGRGIFKQNLGDNQGSITDFNQAIKLKPDDATAYNNRGSAKYKLGDNQEAITDYNQAIKLKPDYANAYYNRGLVYQKLNDNQNAINDFRQAAKLYKQQNNQTGYQNSLDKLKELGISN